MIVYKFNYKGRISTRYDEYMIHKTGLCQIKFTDDIDIDQVIKNITPKIKNKIKELLSIKIYGRSYLVPKKWYQTEIYPPDLFNFEQLRYKTHFIDDYNINNYHFFCSIIIDKKFLNSIIEMDIE